MPDKVTAESFLMEMARDLNGTVKDPEFDSINAFKRRGGGDPKVGDIVDIDIKGPENGSVILGELGTTYFVFQTIDCPKYGSHPENGSREFGFQRNGNTVTFYTRGVSRPGNFITGFFGSGPQKAGWTALVRGISKQITARGGTSNFNTFSTVKEKHPN
jgi:hypothetical protein